MIALLDDERGGSIGRRLSAARQVMTEMREAPAERCQTHVIAPQMAMCYKDVRRIRHGYGYVKRDKASHAMPQKMANTGALRQMSAAPAVERGR